MRRAARRGLVALACAVAASAAPLTVLAASGQNSVAVSAGTYYVTQIGEGAIAKVDVSTNGDVHVTPHFIQGLPGSGPDSAVFAPDGTLLVSNFGAGSISRVDVTTRRILTQQVNRTLIPTVADMALDPNGNDVWAISWSGSGTEALARVDLGTGRTDFMNPGNLSDVGGIAFNLDGTRLFVSSHQGFVAELDPHTGRVVRKVTLSGNPDGMSFDPSSGYLYVAGCSSGICEVDTGNSALHLRRVLTATNGDGLAADGSGHLYVAEAGCGALCRVDLATDTAVLISDDVPSADDVVPVTGAGSAAGTTCRTLATCYGGAAAAGVAAAGIGVVVFLGMAGFNAGGAPLRVEAAASHGTLQAAAPPAAGAAHAATQATTGAHAGAHAAAAGGTELTHMQEESGDKLLEAGGSGVEHGVRSSMLPVVEEEEMEAEAGAGGSIGGARAARDDDEPPPPPPPPPPTGPPPA